MSITVSKVERSDLNDLVTLFDKYRIFYKQESDLHSARNFISERLENDDSLIFVSRNSAGEATGFTQLYPTYSSQSMQKMWILNDLYVDEDYRKQGIASALIHRADAFARRTHAKGLLLCTQHSNLEAQALYKKSGFVAVDEFQWHFLSASNP